MDKNDILKKIAPCGLSCETCFAFRDGPVQRYSRLLSESLGNFAARAPRMAKLLDEPVFNVYPYFKLQLDYFSEVDCAGCRQDNCRLYKACLVRSCAASHHVDFCYECTNFPCNDTGFDEDLTLRWKHNNYRLKELGAEAYYDATKNSHRYP